MPTSSGSYKKQLGNSKRNQRRNNKHAEDSYGTPTQAEWDTMDDVEEIIVPITDEENQVFRVGNRCGVRPISLLFFHCGYELLYSVTIHPEGVPLNPGGPSLPLEEVWIADIVNIRRRNGDDDDVWAEVRWYYRGDEVPDVVESL